jgi:adenine-specific DNA-methyltransferase
MMDKLKMHSPDLTQDNITKIQTMFPGCVTEATDENGKIRLVVDFDQLRQELSDNIVEGPQERYHLNWPGKREALITANSPIAKTLRPARDESVDFDITQNLFIEGDNLEALKLLQETYLGKVKMIYIDPPYNKGKDFVYRDIFAESNDEFLKSSNQKSDDGDKMIANLESEGRFHSRWLSMVLPRLKLARNLLKEDGIMFISIDESEVTNLEKVCEEVFGADNILGNFPVVMNLKGNQDAFGFAETHEYFIACMKSKDKCKLFHFPVDDEQMLKEWLEDEYGLFKEADNLRATGVNAPREKRPNLWYPIFVNPDDLTFYISEDNQPEFATHETVWPVSPDGTELSWYWQRSTFKDSKHNLILKKTKNGWQFYKKQRPSLGELPTKKPKSFFYKPDYSTSTATTQLKELMGEKLFDGPKPVPFLKDLLQIGTSEGDLVVDFFAGSGSTAQAIFELSNSSGLNRKSILIQWPEETPADSLASKSGYSTIAEISKERIRRAGQKALEGECHPDWDKDIGFRVLKIDSSNMADVFYAPDDTTQTGLLDLVDNIKPDRTPEDLLFHVLLDWGVDLTLPIRQETIHNKTVFFVADNALVACFDSGITDELIKELTAHKPIRVVFRDVAFKDDSAKINSSQIFKSLSPATKIMVL